MIIIVPAPVLVPDTFFVTFIVVFTLAIVPIAMRALPGPAGPGPARGRATCGSHLATANKR